MATHTASAAVLSGASGDFVTFIAQFGAQVTVRTDGPVGALLEILIACWHVRPGEQ